MVEGYQDPVDLPGCLLSATKIIMHLHLSILLFCTFEGLAGAVDGIDLLAIVDRGPLTNLVVAIKPMIDHFPLPSLQPDVDVGTSAILFSLSAIISSPTSSPLSFSLLIFPTSP